MSQRPRGPGLVHGALALALIVALATLAMTQRQPPPPTIAEFAPQAVENITDAPNDQSSGFGRAGGLGGEGGGLGAAPPASPSAIDVPRVRRCVGDPPRQIEDPQSPPCVPYWQGDNGGATYKGVTRDEIRIARDGDTDALVAFFNKRFEFYGRKIVVVGQTGNQEGSDANDAVNRAAATQNDEQLHVFAGLPSDADDGAYMDEMARRGLVSVEYRAYHVEGWLAGRHPYMWEYMMAADHLEVALGAWACSRLAGRPARFSGDPTQSKRVFGMIMQKREGNPLDGAPLERALGRCGEKFAAYTEFTPEDSAGTGIVRMKTAGVTSIFCMCNVTATGLYAKSASSQGYFPEWLLSSFQYNDESFQTQTLGGDRAQLEHTFGLSVQPKHVTPTASPAWWAIKEMDPQSTELGPSDTGNSLSAAGRNQEYRSLLLFASGVQMAGPKLTAQTFAQGLQRTRFPNPQTPLMAGNVGFLDADHTMTDDVAEWWWSNSDRGPYSDEGAGTICYVDGGKRHTAGSWDAGDATLFQRPCDSGRI